MRDWHSGTQGDDWISMAVPSEMGDYGIADNLIFSYPVRVNNGTIEVINGLEWSDFAQEKIRASEAELLEEREVVANLLTA
jgi:malate dehydrogenase